MFMQDCDERDAMFRKKRNGCRFFLSATIRRGISLNNFQRDLTEGSVTGQLLKFSMPFLFSNLLQALYNLADMLIVGNFCGPTGASAVGMGGQVTILVINLISGLAVGGTVLIAQYIGAQRHKEVERTVGTVFTLYLAAGAVLTVIMLLLSAPILTAMNISHEAFDDTLAYLNICMAGTVFVCGYNAVSAVLRGMGDSRHPLIFVAIATVVNILLDLLLVGPLHMGPSGAALATITAQAASFVISVIFLRRRNFVFDFHPRSFRIDKHLAGRLVKLGLPASLQGTLVSLSFMVLTGIANAVAVERLIGSTALSIAGKVNSIAILPSMAMQASVSSMAGQNIGAGKPERAKKTMFVAMGLSFAVSLIVFVLVNLFPTQIIHVFIGFSQDESITEEMRILIIRESAKYIQCISWDYLLTSIVFCINGLAIGVGQTLFSMINSGVGSILLRIPAAWLLGYTFGLGLGGVGYAAPIATAGSLIIGIVYLCTGSWRRHRLQDIRGRQEAAES